MRLTYKGDYATKVILELALAYPNRVITNQDLAVAVDAPPKFLEQVLADLKRGGFVESRRGKAGGYVLTLPPKDIRLGEIIRFIDGHVEPIACVKNGYQGCQHVGQCALQDVWIKVDKSISSIVDTTTFEDLAQATLQRNRSQGES